MATLLEKVSTLIGANLHALVDKAFLQDVAHWKRLVDTSGPAASTFARSFTRWTFGRSTILSYERFGRDSIDEC